MISSHTNPHSLSTRLRRKRMRFLDPALGQCVKDRIGIVDLGGTKSFWEMNLQHLDLAGRIERIDIYNLEVKAELVDQIGSVTIRQLPGDATRLIEVPDKHYDVAFSNSVIEHVGNLSEQYRFAREIRRISGYYVIQTPSRYFPLEPHFYVPFFQFMPLSVRTALHRRFKLGWLVAEPDILQARIDCDQIRLLSRRELMLLFPEDRIEHEWFCGLIKSFIVVGGSG